MRCFCPYLRTNRGSLLFLGLLVLLLSSSFGVKAQELPAAAKEAFELGLACNTLDYDCQIKYYAKDMMEIAGNEENGKGSYYDLFYRYWGENWMINLRNSPALQKMEVNY